jgi:hypothetical protein
MTEQKKSFDDFDAVKSLVGALENFSDEERKRIIRWACEKLGTKYEEKSTLVSNVIAPVIPEKQESFLQNPNKTVDIRSLRTEKSPKSGIQMAVLVAYYLKEYAPLNEKQDYVTDDDITKYFTQASFPLPRGKARFTLTNAKNAGYLEAIGNGQYKLNPVGFNLAAYSMPETKNAASLKRKGNIVKKQKSKKKSTKK